MNLFFWTEEYLKRKAYLEDWLYEIKEYYFIVKVKNKIIKKEKNSIYYVFEKLDDFKTEYENNMKEKKDEKNIKEYAYMNPYNIKNIVVVTLNTKKNIVFLKENINFFFNIKNLKILFVNNKEENKEYWVFNNNFLKKFSDEKTFIKNIKSYIGETKIL